MPFIFTLRNPTSTLIINNISRSLYLNQFIKYIHNDDEDDFCL